MEKYYIVVNGEKKGPYALSQLRDMWKSGAITMDTKYASEGMTGWADIGDLMEPEAGGDIVVEPTPLSLRESAKKELESKSIKKNIVKSAHVELKDCPACGEAISRDAATCPACGCNFYQRWMRIFLTIILPSIIAVLVFFWVLTTVLKTATQTTLSWGVGLFLFSLLISICIINKDRFFAESFVDYTKPLIILFWLIGFAVALWGGSGIGERYSESHDAKIISEAKAKGLFFNSKDERIINAARRKALGYDSTNWYGLTLFAVLYLIASGGIYLFIRRKQDQGEVIKEYVSWKKESGRSDD